MRAYKKYRIFYDEKVFDIHFRNHVRNFWRKSGEYSYAAYAKHVCEPLTYIERLASGKDHPSESILRDMEVTWTNPKRQYCQTKYDYLDDDEIHNERHS